MLSRVHLSRIRATGVALVLGQLLLSMALYNVLQNEQTRKLGLQVQTEAHWLQRHFEGSLRERVTAVDRMAGRWMSGAGTSYAVWQQDAQAYLLDLSGGLLALQWVDAQGQLRWVASDLPEETARRLHALQAAQRSHHFERARPSDMPLFSGQMDVGGGRRGMLLVHPLFAAGRFDGYLTALFHTDALLARLSEEVAARGYAIDVRSLGEVLYRQGDPPGPQSQGMVKHLSVNVGESTWEIRLWPTPATVAEQSSALPLLVLASGVALAALLGIAFGLWDLGERRRQQLGLANRALNESNDLVERTAQIAKVGGWEIALPSRVLHRTPQAFRIQELEPAGAFSLEDAFNAYAPEARPLIRQAVDAAITRGTPFDMEAPFVTASGRPIWVRVQGQPQTVDGQVVRLTGTLQDITERRDIEARLAQQQEALRATSEQLQAILDGMVDGVVTIDEQGTVGSWNPAAERIFGYPAQAVIGRNISMVMPQPHRGGHDGYLQNYLRTGVAGIIGIGREVQGQRQDGALFPMDLSISHVKRHGKSLFIGLVRDITARKAAESALVAAKEAAERASQAKSQFLNSMSHELRTPLNAILGFAQVMEQDTGLSADYRENLGDIVRAGWHLLELVNEVLSLSRLEEGRSDWVPEPVDCSALVDECLAMVRPLAQARGIRLAQASPSAWVVRADRTKLKQALINLLSNAIKYNRPQGSVQVQVGLSAAGQVRLEVLDTGAGIAAERFAELFQPFSRLGAEKGPIEGIGIGLVITRRIVELMGGQVGLESRVGVGSSFWIELPCETRSMDTPDPCERGLKNS